MAEPIDAPAPAPTGESEQTPQNTNPESAQGAEQTPAPAPAPAPDMHGFTSEQLADIDKFFKANGGFDAIKNKISNPTPAQTPAQTLAEAPQAASQPQNDAQPTSQSAAPYRAPEGSISVQEFFAKQYFQSLAGEEKYAAISKEVAKGDVLQEMARFRIPAFNPDGSINDGMVRDFLDLKAQTVPAKPTETEPDASAAPTVNYVEVGDKIENIDQAYQVLMQPTHPKIKEAEEFVRAHLNPGQKTDK